MFQPLGHIARKEGNYYVEITFKRKQLSIITSSISHRNYRAQQIAGNCQYILTFKNIDLKTKLKLHPDHHCNELANGPQAPPV
jgi:hypothetical protein